MYLDVVLFGLIWFWTLCLLGLNIIFLRLKKFSVIISSNNFLPFFLLSGAPIVWMLVNLMLFQKSLKLSSFLRLLSFLSVHLRWFPLLCIPVHWLIPIYHVICHWVLLVFGSSLYFLTFCWTFHLFIFSSEFVDNIFDHYLNCIWWLISTSFIFLRFGFHIYMEHIPLSPHFAYFSVFMSVIFPLVEKWPFVGIHSLGLSSPCCPDHQRHIL